MRHIRTCGINFAHTAAAYIHIALSFEPGNPKGGFIFSGGRLVSPSRSGSECRMMVAAYYRCLSRRFLNHSFVVFVEVP
jgi:hypothetical protein